MTTKDDVERAALIERLRSVASYFDHKPLPVAFMDGTRYSDFLRRHAAALALPPQVSVTEAMVEAGAQANADMVRRGYKLESLPLTQMSKEDREAMVATSRTVLQAALSAVPAGRLPQDVIDLVIAARNVAFDTSGPTSEYLAALDRASEAFADRVPWDDVPEEDELTAAVPAGGDWQHDEELFDRLRFLHGGMTDHASYQVVCDAIDRIRHCPTAPEPSDGELREPVARALALHSFTLAGNDPTYAANRVALGDWRDYIDDAAVAIAAMREAARRGGSAT